jgi:hypothetical protein
MHIRELGKERSEVLKELEDDPCDCWCYCYAPQDGTCVSLVTSCCCNSFKPDW